MTRRVEAVALPVGMSARDQDFFWIGIASVHSRVLGFPAKAFWDAARATSLENHSKVLLIMTDAFGVVIQIDLRSRLQEPS